MGLPADRSQTNASPRSGPRGLRQWLIRSIPLGVGLIVGALAGVAFAAIIDVPRIDTLSDFTPSLITELLDREKQPFATYARERRFLLAEGEVPEIVQQAVLAGEDGNFFQHGGVDPEGVARAVFKNFLSQSGGRIGGSTLTMQLARKIYLTTEKTWRRKVEEAFLTVEMEKNFSKQQILTLYCNVMYFGHGNYGIEAAARSFLGKPAAELDAAEAATLVGILQRPSAYSPYRRPDLVLGRRNYVLRRMLDEGYLDQNDLDEAIARPLEVVQQTKESLLAPYFAEEVRKDIEKRYGSETLLEKGLQIQTTLDPQIQKAVETAVTRGLERIDRTRGWRGAIDHLETEKKDLENTQLESWGAAIPEPGVWQQGVVLTATGRNAAIKIRDRIYDLGPKGIAWTRKNRPRDVLKPGDIAWFRIEESADPEDPAKIFLEQEPSIEGAAVVLESATGAIRAMVGGWSYDRSKFNRATQAVRQVGSAFKPFVYGAAIESGYTLADTFFDAPIALPGTTNVLEYSPRNYYRDYNGISTMRRALELSMNVTAVKVLDMVGPERVVEFARRCGIQSDLPPYPSLALGAADLTPLEVAAAYAAIANQGLHVEPYLIESIKEPDGHPLMLHQTQAHKSMDPETAFLLTQMLSGVIDRGTGTAAKDLPLDLAGKTGTTDDFSDAWFAGFSPRFTVLVWVGRDQKKPIGRNMTGAEAALPIWKEILEQGLEEGWIMAGERFTEPPGLVVQRIEYKTGFLATPEAEQVIPEYFLEGTEPALSWEEKWRRIMELPWYQQAVHYVPKAGERMPEDVDDWTPILESWDRSR